MLDIKQEIARVKLKDMFRKSYFSISDVTDLCKMLNVVQDSETMRMMQPLHCVNFGDMSPVLREWLFAECLALVVNGARFNLEVIDQILPELNAPSGFKFNQYLSERVKETVTQ